MFNVVNRERFLIKMLIFVHNVTSHVYHVLVQIIINVLNVIIDIHLKIGMGNKFVPYNWDAMMEHFKVII